MKTTLPARFVFLSLLVGAVALAAEPTPRVFAVVVLPNPRAVAVDPAGNLYVGDVATPQIYRISPAGQVTRLNRGGPVLAEPVGRGGIQAIVAPEGGNGPVIADPIGLAVGRDGTVFVSDADANTVYQILPNDWLMVWVGPSPELTDKSLSAPTSIVLDAAGNAYVTNNSGNAVLRISPVGVATVLAGRRGEAGSADGIGATARFGKPRGIAIDGNGNLYVADETQSNIRRITPDGVVTTIVGAAKP